MGNEINYHVSVCISVHNTEKLLRRCLDSVVSQTLKEIEVVLVNNGSTDSSLDIMQEYKVKHPEMIKIYSQDDMGLAQGRQTGINNANGEYITFLDADDYVKNDAYEKMYESAIYQNVDIVECRTFRDGKIIESKYTGVHKASKILKDYFLYSEIPPMMWMRLYKRRLFDKPVLPNIYVNNEDIFAFPCILNKAEDIFYLKEQLHYYTTDNEQSVMNIIKHQIANEERVIENRIKTLSVVEHINKELGRDYISNNLSQEFKIYTARVILDFCLNNFKSLTPDESVNIAINNTGANIIDIMPCYKDINYSNKLIKKSVNFFGLLNTITIYRFMTNIRRKIG
ncbi:glycosyltransferase [Vibrio splendidus]|uniref:glycosyltransferase family 2 protein n=1 Tax=Vibrio splendidus TaxID=29497 RepID=UPI001FB54832|nr:glycosyltransferase [Vibrio splendidus]UOE88713.1 glycosyltransferase [Vibrio splendidus]